MMESKSVTSKSTRARLYRSLSSHLLPKVDIYIGIQSRDRLSLGANRIRLGQRAFNWSIIVLTDEQYHRFDITDGIVLDPVTSKDINQQRSWIFRHNVTSSLAAIPRYLGSVQVYAKSTEVTISKLERVLENVAMPSSTSDRAHENSVSWTVDAIRAMQRAGICEPFDLDALQEFALTHADKRMADFKNRIDPIKFAPSSMRWLRLF